MGHKILLMTHPGVHEKTNPTHLCNFLSTQKKTWGIAENDGNLSGTPLAGETINLKILEDAGNILAVS